MNRNCSFRLRVLGLLALGAAFVGGESAQADATWNMPRHQVDQRGDFVLIGNTLGYDCRSGLIPPTVGTVGPCGADPEMEKYNITDTGIDVFWKVTSATTVEANKTVAPADASSVAVLGLPANAKITYARLYWAATIQKDTVVNSKVKLGRLGTGAFSQEVTADSTNTINDILGGPSGKSWSVYQYSTDVTQLVQTQGVGPYQFSNLTVYDVRTKENIEVAYAAWSMVVVYQLDGDRLRNITVFDGLEKVQNGSSTKVTVQGFQVPNAGFDAKMGVIAYEGDATINGDSLKFNPAKSGESRLLDLPVASGGNLDNFFNSSRATYDAAMNVQVPVTVVGDLPQTTGAIGSRHGYDLDIVNVSGRLAAGETSAEVVASTSRDVYQLGVVITSVSTLNPLFDRVVKSYTDLTGDPSLHKRGDVIRYRIENLEQNRGDDDADYVYIEDVLPAGVTYVPNSICLIQTGKAACPANGSNISDTAGNDEGEYVVSGTTRKIVVRVGTGANGTKGGQIPKMPPTPAPIAVEFSVTIDADASGEIANIVTIFAKSQKALDQQPNPKDPSKIPNVTITSGIWKDTTKTDIIPRTPVKFNVTQCTDNSDCPQGDRCNTTTHQCEHPCTDDSQCPAGQKCTGGVCSSPADLELTAMANASNEENAITYALVVKNVGTVSVPGAVLTYNIPAGVAVQSASGNGWTVNQTADKVVFTRTTAMAVGSSWELQISLVIGTCVPSVPFHARVEATGVTETNLSNNEATLSTEMPDCGLAGGGFTCAAVPASTTVSYQLGLLLMALTVSLYALYRKVLRVRKAA